MAPAAIAALEEALAVNNVLLVKLGVPDPLLRAVADWHQHCYFTVEGILDHARTLVGTRPGDPLADAVFAFAFSRFLGELSSRLRVAGLGIELPLRGTSIFGGAGVAPSTVDLDGPAYMDDFVIPIMGPAAELLPRIAEAGNIMLQLAAEYGLCINFKPGKTECVLAMRGLGTAQGRRAWAALPVQDGVPCIPLNGGAQLRIVRSYVHLGICASPLSLDSAEVAAKARACRVAAAALRRPILSNPAFSVATKLHVAAACAHTRATWSAGSWPAPSDKQLARLQSAFMYPHAGHRGGGSWPAAGGTNHAAAYK